MRVPSAQDIVRVWELGQEQPAWYRGWLMLAAAFPKKTQRELTALTIGQRDTYLFRMREQILGPQLLAFVRCPRCADAIEFALDSREICAVDPERALATEHIAAIEGVEVRFRLLTSRDLAA